MLRRRSEGILKRPTSPKESRARLARIVDRAPEVMVKVTGRTRDPARLTAHLMYISRTGKLELETPDGWLLQGTKEVKDLAEHWGDMAMTDFRRRANTPVSLSLMLSMPRGTDPSVVRDGARGFAQEAFGGRYEYVFTLHTDEPHPHIHMAVRWLGLSGQRLNPRAADLEWWREIFARELRERGVVAEATPRHARGVTRKAERTAIRKLRERAEAGVGPPVRVHRDAIHAAARAAFGGDAEPTPWEKHLVQRQQRMRALYLAQALLLRRSADVTDRELAKKVEAFVRDMPAPDTQRLALARALREANRRLQVNLDRNREHAITHPSRER